MNDAGFVAAMQRGIERFVDYRDSIPFLRAGYTRMLLSKCDAYELIAMQWAAGSQSPIHDHGDSRCWIVTLEGNLDVENFQRLDDGSAAVARLERRERMRVTAGELDHRYNRNELHRVRNTGTASTFSLQLYAAPLVEYTVVEESTGIARFVPSIYDAAFEL